MRNRNDTDELTATPLLPDMALQLNAAMARLSDAIVLLDALGAGNTGLGLAAAHAETALHLVAAEITPDMEP